MRTLPNYCHNSLTINSTQHININMPTGSIFNCPTMLNSGIVNNNCEFFGMNFGFSFAPFLSLPFVNPMFNFMNAFNPMNFMSPMSSMWQFNNGFKFWNNSSSTNNNDGVDNCQCKCNCNCDSSDIENDTDSESVSSENSGDVQTDNSDTKSQQTTVSVKKSKRHRHKKKVSVATREVKQSEEFNALPDKIKDAVKSVAADAMEKLFKNGKITPQEVLPIRAEIIIDNINIVPIYKTKTGTNNDYFNRDGDIVRVQDATKLEMKFKYFGKPCTYVAYIDNFSHKLKPQTLVQKIYKGEKEKE